MAKKTLNILTVCGSGVVTCSMFDQRIREHLSSLGVDITINGTLPPSVESLVNRGDVDFVVSTTKLPGKIDVPVIMGVSLLSGFGEDETLEEIMKVATDTLAAK
jgi:PTS system galactitol-specific IIB component